MDVGIVVAGVSVGVVISRRFREDQRLLTISIGLSIALFCSSILELLPTELSLSYRNGNFLRYVYHWILYGINAQCFVVIPTAAFMSILAFPASTRKPLDEEEHKKRSFRRNYWWNCYIYRPMVATFQPILSFCLPNATTTYSLPTSIVPSPTQRSTLRSIFHKRVFFALVFGTSSMFWTLSRIRSIILLTDDASETWLQVATSSLCAIGILLSAILNGFASVSLPYTFLLGFFLHPVSDMSIRNAQQELENLRLRLESTTNIADAPRIVRRHRSSDVLEDQPPSQQQNLHQKDFLRALLADMVADMDEMKYVQSYNHQRGMVHRIVGSIGGIVMLVRWSVAVRNVCNGAPTSSIPLLEAMFPNVEESTAQVISVVLTALLSITQLRTFVNVATAVERRVRRTCCVCMTQPNDSTTSVSHTINATFSLFIGFLLDCYTLACVVLTKQMMIPRNDPTDVLYLHQVRTNRYMFDLTFASSALVSTAVLAMVLGILRANSQRWHTATAAAEAASASKARLVEV